MMIFETFGPALLGVVAFLGLYWRHRKTPVAGPFWAIPIGLAGLTGFIPALLDLLEPIDFTQITPENRHRVGAQILEAATAQIEAGLLAVTIVGLLGVWLVPRPEDDVSIAKKSVIPVAVLAVIGTAVGLVYAAKAGPPGAMLIVALSGPILIFGHIGLIRATSRPLTPDRAYTSAAYGAVGLFAWPVMLLAHGLLMRWSAVSTASLAASPSLVARAGHYLDFQQNLFIGYMMVFSISLFQVRLRSTGQAPANRGKGGKSIVISAVLSVVLSIPVGWTIHEYDQLNETVRALQKAYLEPLESQKDVDLAASGKTGLPPEDLTMVKIGRKSTTVSSDLQQTNERSAESPAELRSALDQTIAKEKKEKELLGQLYDPMIVIAMDRCEPYAKLRDVFAASRDRGIWKFKLAIDGEKAARVVNVRAIDTDEVDGERMPTFRYRVHVTKEGATVTVDNNALPPIEGCPDDGPTVCVKPSPTGSCAGSYDEEALRSAVVEASMAYPDDRAYLLTVDDDVPWAAPAALMGAIRWKNPEDFGTRPQVNELLTDPFFLINP